MDIVRYLSDQNTKWGGIYWDRELERRFQDDKHLEQYGYKVYSQNDEDGIIHEIFKRIGYTSKIFIEFGVDIGLESNCHSLLLQGWKGLWIEGRNEAYRQILRRFAPAIHQNRLSVLNEYVNVDNINHIIDDYLHDHTELDLLSIDVDGNDWHIWKAVDCIRPRVVVIEYNGKFPPEIDWVMPYNPDHIWDRSDRQGASLKALEKLGYEKGYDLVGTNICGINAFFVRMDLTNGAFVKPATAENTYNPARMNLLRFANGHPSRNYVGSNIEGMEGVFEYYPDWNCIASYGFYPFIVYDNKRSFVMSEKEGRLFIRWIPENTKSIVVIYKCSFEEIERESITIKLTVDKQCKREYTIRKKEGTIRVDVGGIHFTDDIIPLDITISKTWCPNEDIYGSGWKSVGCEIVEISYE